MNPGRLYEAVLPECKKTGFIMERHRHRYEVNPKFIADLETRGIRFVGKDEKRERMEILELDGTLCLPFLSFEPSFNRALYENGLLFCTER